MPVILLMNCVTVARIGKRLRALGLDLAVATFDNRGRILQGGVWRAPHT